MEKKKDDFIVHSVKSYPDLPVPQTEGIDKEKQHKDDIAETKKRLELLRQRKLAEMQKNKKSRRKSSSTSSSSSAATPKVEQSKAVTKTTDEVKEDDIKRYDNKGDDDSDSDIEVKKKMAVRKSRKKRIRDDDSESESDAKASQVDDQDDLIEKLVLMSD